MGAAGIATRRLGRRAKDGSDPRYAKLIATSKHFEGYHMESWNGEVVSAALADAGSLTAVGRRKAVQIVALRACARGISAIVRGHTQPASSSTILTLISANITWSPSLLPWVPASAP